MKSIFITLLMITSSAFAGEINGPGDVGSVVNMMSRTEKQVLRAIIANSKSIQLINSDSGNPMPESLQLPGMLALYLTEGYKSSENGYSRLYNLNLTCRDKTTKTGYPQATHVCGLEIHFASFKKENNSKSLIGPESEYMQRMFVEVKIESEKVTILTKSTKIQ